MACWETPHLNENLPPQNHPIISHEDPRYNIPKSSQNHPMTLSHHKIPRRNHGFAWRFSPDLVMRGDLRGGRIACGVNGILGADECHHLWRDGMGWASPIFTLNASKRTRISLEPKFFYIWVLRFWFQGHVETQKSGRIRNGNGTQTPGVFETGRASIAANICQRSQLPRKCGVLVTNVAASASVSDEWRAVDVLLTPWIPLRFHKPKRDFSWFFTHEKWGFFWFIMIYPSRIGI